MKTRKQYLAGECTHREFYAQFVTDHVRNRVAVRFGRPRLEASTDPHMNDIPLAEWDTLGPVGSKAKWDELGDFPTMAGRTCIYKEAAKQLVESWA
jgi:hypothetical protein